MMQNARLTFLALCLTFATSFFLGSCSNQAPAPDGSVTVTFAAGGAPNEIKAWQGLLAGFEKAHPKIKVKLHRLPANSDLQLQAHTTALGTGKAPYDLMRLDIVWLASFASRGWLEPLQRDFKETELAAFGNLVDRVDRIDGELMALPWNVDMGLLYYRKDLLEKHGVAGPPKTWVALEEAAKRIIEKEGAPLEGFVWQGKAYEGLTCNFVEHYASSGGKMEAVEKSLAFEREPALKALDRMRGLIAKGLSPQNTATEMTEEPSRILFMQGRAVFMRNWPYAAALLEEEGSPVKGKVGVTTLPGEQSGSGAATLGGWHLGLRSGSPVREQALALLRYLVSVESQVSLARDLGWNPSHLKAYDQLDNPALKPIRKALGQGVSRPRVKLYSDFSRKTYETVSAVLLDSISPLEGAKRLAKK